MNREEILKLSKETLEFGKAFNAGLDRLSELSEEDTALFEQLCEDGDEECIALNNEYELLFDQLNM